VADVASDKVKNVAEPEEIAGKVAAQAREYGEKAKEAVKNFKPYVDKSMKKQPHGHLRRSRSHRVRAWRSLEGVERYQLGRILCLSPLSSRPRTNSARRRFCVGSSRVSKASSSFAMLVVEEEAWLGDRMTFRVRALAKWLQEGLMSPTIMFSWK
jgi:hypothetical protein